MNCGKVYRHSTNASIFLVTRFLYIANIVLPFLRNHPFIGAKSKDLEDFCKAAELIKNKAHLTESGLEQLRQIKIGMNTGRVNI